MSARGAPAPRRAVVFGEVGVSFPRGLSAPVSGGHREFPSVALVGGAAREEIGSVWDIFVSAPFKNGMYLKEEERVARLLFPRLINLYGKQRNEKAKFRFWWKRGKAVR